MSRAEKTAVDRKRPPPVKVLSGQLRTAGGGGGSGQLRTAGGGGGSGQLRTAGGGGGSDSGEGVRVRVGPGRSLLVSLVWMQGTIIEVQLDRNAVLLMDETGTFTVQGVDAIPRGTPCLSQGKYVMVMGVVQAASPEPVIRAVKVADLSEQAALHRRMWKLEVDDLQRVMA